MAHLTQDDVRELGIAAIRRVIGDTFSKVDLKVELDLDDRPAYNIRLQFPTADDWQNASARISDITGAVMEDLAIREDDSFPFVWLLSDGSWTFEHDAAAQ